MKSFISLHLPHFFHYQNVLIWWINCSQRLRNKVKKLYFLKDNDYLHIFKTAKVEFSMLALAMFNSNTAWAELMHVCVIASGESAFNTMYSVAKFYQREKKLYYYKSFVFELFRGVFGLFKMWRQASKTNKGSCFFCS